MSKLTLVQADIVISKALEKAHAAGAPALAVVVLDDAGHVKAARREDGANMFRFDVALGKAWAAVAMCSSSRAVAKRAQDAPSFINALAVTGQGKFLPQPGAVLIRSADGEILGAVGISGSKSDEDEAFGAYGVEQASLVPGI